MEPLLIYCCTKSINICGQVWLVGDVVCDILIAGAMLTLVRLKDLKYPPSLSDPQNILFNSYLRRETKIPREANASSETLCALLSRQIHSLVRAYCSGSDGILTPSW
jgi:hypothetical protein